MATVFTNLRAMLAGQASDDCCALVEPRLSLTRSQLATSTDNWRSSDEGQRLFGGTVLVEAESDISSLVSLVRLDGWCQAIVLLPKDIDEERKHKFLELASATGIYTAKDATVLVHKPQPAIESSPVGKFETKWIVPTSGTTGTPKLFAHTLESLSKTVKTNLKRGSQLIWGLLYDPFRFAGLQVFFQSLFGGSSLVIPANRSDLDSAFGFFAQNGVNAISATPTFWRKLLLSGMEKRFSFRQITLGGEIADSKILDSLKKSFPESRLVHIYASTEAGVGFAVSDFQAGFPTTFVENGLPSGVQLAVDESGQLLVKKTSYSPIELGQVSTGFSDWIGTGDKVVRKGDRYFFLGRINGAINVGGNKVMPEEVESVIRMVDGVRDVKVEGRVNSITGQIVQALVVPKNEDATEEHLKKTIIQVCKQKLEPYKVPAIVRLVSSLETTSAGKVKR